VQFDSFASYDNLNMISIVDVENSLGLVFIFISLISYAFCFLNEKNIPTALEYPIRA